MMKRSKKLTTSEWYLLVFMTFIDRNKEFEDPRTGTLRRVFTALRLHVNYQPFAELNVLANKAMQTGFWFNLLSKMGKLHRLYVWARIPRMKMLDRKYTAFRKAHDVKTDYWIDGSLLSDITSILSKCKRELLLLTREQQDQFKKDVAEANSTPLQLMTL